MGTGISDISSRALTILFATESGRSCYLAERAAQAAAGIGLPARIRDMATYNTTQFQHELDVLVITSTHGEGEPPATAIDFFDFLDAARLELGAVRFAVLALGDSGYDEFCAAGRRLDERLAQLGGTRLAPLLEVDVGDVKAAQGWAAELVGLFAEQNRVAAE